MEGKYGRDDDESTEDGSGSARDSVARHNVSLTSNKVNILPVLQSKFPHLIRSVRVQSTIP